MNAIPNRIQTHLIRFFIGSAAIILLLTGAAKVIGAFTGGDVLQTYDPIFGITYGRLLLLVGVVEIGVGLVCLCVQNPHLATSLVLSLALGFLAYRIGMQWVDSPKFCSCLGTFTGVLHIAPVTADFAMKVVLAYLLVGSGIALFLLWKGKPVTSSSKGSLAMKLQ
jgi:hypothetical protein